MPGRLEHVDRIIGNGVDQELEALRRDIVVELHGSVHDTPSSRDAAEKPYPRPAS